jgi:hypothetical protein
LTRSCSADSWNSDQTVTEVIAGLAIGGKRSVISSGLVAGGKIIMPCTGRGWAGGRIIMPSTRCGARENRHAKGGEGKAGESSCQIQGGVWQSEESSCHAQGGQAGSTI